MAFQKVKLLSVDSIFIFFQKVLADVFWQNWDEPVCSCSSAVVFVVELCQADHACQFLSCGGMANTDLYWGKVSPAGHSGLFCDLLDESSLHTQGHFGILLGSLSVVPCVRHLWNLRNKRLFLNLFQTDGSQVVSFSFLLEFPWLCVSSFRGPFGLLHLVRQILLEWFLDWEHVWQ